MRKITAIGSVLMLAGLGFSASAQELGLGTVLEGPQNGSYVVSGYKIEMTWSGKEVSFATETPSFQVIYNGGEPQTATTVTLGSEWEPAEDQAEVVTFNFFAFMNTTDPEDPLNSTPKYGEFEIVIPEGLVESDGETNAAQTIEFTVCKKLADDDADVTPEVSMLTWDANDNNVYAPQYLPSELEDITISWPGIVLLPTGADLAPVAYLNVESQGGVPNYIPIKDLVTVDEDGIHVDLSSFEDGFWYIQIPGGYVLGAEEDLTDPVYDYTNANLTFSFYITSNVTLPSMSDYQVLTPAESNYLTYLTSVNITFGGQKIMLTNPGTTDDEEDDENSGIDPLAEGTTVPVNFGGETYNIVPDVYENWQGQYVLDINFWEEANAAGNPAGEYKIVIPEGLVKNNAGEENEEITLTYNKFNLISDKDIETSPTTGNQPIEKLDVITVTFVGFDEIVLNEEAGDLDVYMGEYITNEGYRDTYTIEQSSLTVKDNVVTIPLDIEDLTEGEPITLHLPTYLVIADDAYLSPSLSLEYTPWNGLPEAEIMFAPDGDVVKGQISPIQVTWNYEAVTLTPGLKAQLISAYSLSYNPELIAEIELNESNLFYVEEPGEEPGEPDNGEPEGPSVQADETNAPNVLRFTIDSYLEDLTEGHYFVVLPAGLVQNDAEQISPYQVVAEFELFTIWGGKANIEENDGEILISWEDSTWVYQVNYETTPYLVDPEGDQIELEEMYNNWDGTYGEGQWVVLNNWDDDFDAIGGPDFHGIYVNVNDLNLEDGEYTLVIPETFLQIMDDDGNMGVNNPISYVFTMEDGVMTDVKTVSSLVNDGVYRVYNLNGVKVLETKDASDVKALNSGLYIINGKKVIIRK